jgi:hypothetical protein
MGWVIGVILVVCVMLYGICLVKVAKPPLAPPDKNQK